RFETAAVSDERIELPISCIWEGFSCGGLPAQRLAAAAPQRIRRMIVASSTIVPIPINAYDSWTDRAALLASQADVWSDPALRPGRSPDNLCGAEFLVFLGNRRVQQME
ncbi:alpha/beta fold hydrolase, partial [Nocardia gipuzkoensis]